jgi:hypothetical protein
MDRWAARALLLAVAAVAFPSGARAWGQTPSSVAPPAAVAETPPPSPHPVPPEAAPPPEPPPAPPAVPPSEPPPPAGLPSTAMPPEPAPWPLEGPVVVAMPARETVWRPRLSAAIGMGGTFDAVGFDDKNVRAIPTFVSVLGIGDGPFGLDLGAYASQASGRHGNQNPVDRLALDLFGVVRPGAWYRPADLDYALRVLRGLAAELGLGFERDGRSAVSGTRFVLHVGARADFPITPAREATELRLRIAVRRAIGLYTPKLYGSALSDVTNVSDSAAELYGALVVVF